MNIKHIVLGFSLALAGLPAFSQTTNNLLDELADDKSAVPVGPAFKGTRIIQGHSVQMVTKKHLDFMIQHRFGALNSGSYNFWGLDVATMRLGLDYGLTDNFNIGIGRSSFQKTFDGYAKYRLLRQTKENEIPVTVVLFASTAIKSLKPAPNIKDNYQFTDRLVNTMQVLIARKFGDKLSLQLTPTYIRYNLVADNNYKHEHFAMGVGGRIRLSRSVSLNAEWFPQLDKDKGATNVLSLGFDIETGGHVFQLGFTNSQSMIEKGFITQTTGKWSKGDVYYGFNISRTFSFD